MFTFFSVCDHLYLIVCSVIAHMNSCTYVCTYVYEFMYIYIRMYVCAFNIFIQQVRTYVSAHALRSLHHCRLY